MFNNRMPAAAWAPALLAVLSTGVFLANPEQVFEAASGGVEIWWKFVFPAMMPYFMLTELLLASGLIHFCGRLVSPLTGPLFGLPGSALWAMLSGWIGGYPAGAKATAALTRQGLIQKQQSERLLALSHAAAPALIATVIAAGFFRMPQLALPLLLIHWGSLLAIAAFFALSSSTQSPEKHKGRPSGSIWKQAVQEMRRARIADGRSLGQLLGDSVKHAIEQLFAIGGIIIFCSVAAAMLQRFIPLLHMAAGEAWVSAVLEVHLGAYRIADIRSDEMKLAMAAIGALLGFSGMAMLLQVRALIAKTGIPFRLFIYTRLLHAAFAFALTLAAWDPLVRILSHSTLPVLSPGVPLSTHGPEEMTFTYLWALAAPALSLLLFSAAAVCSMFLLGIKRLAGLLRGL